MHKKRFAKQFLISFAALIGLAGVFIFQYTDILYLISGRQFPQAYHFITNRAVRILLNDTFMLALIYAIFLDPKVVRLAFFVQLFDLLILFPLYVAIKIPLEGVSELSSPFLSQFHRLIVNPTLMILLIPAVLYQKMGISSRN